MIKLFYLLLSLFVMSSCSTFRESRTNYLTNNRSLATPPAKQTLRFVRIDVSRGYVFPISEKSINAKPLYKLVNSAYRAKSSLDLLKSYKKAFPEIRYVISPCENLTRDWDSFVDPTLDKKELATILKRYRPGTSKGIFYSAGTPFSRRELGEKEPTSGFPYPIIILDCSAEIKTTLIHETLHYLFDKSLRRTILNKDVFEELGRFAASDAYSKKMTQEKLGINLSWMSAHYSRDAALELLYYRGAEHLDINSFLIMNSSTLGLSNEEIQYLKKQTANHYLRDYMHHYNQYLVSNNSTLADIYDSLESYPTIISEFEKRFKVIDIIVEELGPQTMKKYYD